MEVITNVAPYYVRKKPIEIVLRASRNTARVTCLVIDNNGRNITNDEGLLYSKRNILSVSCSAGADKHTLMLSFQHARYFVTLKLVATDKDANALETKCFSFRVYSSSPTIQSGHDSKRIRLSESQRNHDVCDNFFDDFDAGGGLFDFDTVESGSSPLEQSGARNVLPHELGEPGPMGTRTNAPAEYFGVPRLPRPCAELHAPRF